MTDDIMNTLPMLPITDKPAKINSLAMRDQSAASVTGENSWLTLLCLMDLPKFLLIAAAACVSEVTSNGAVLAAVVVVLNIAAAATVVLAVDETAVVAVAITPFNKVLLNALFVTKSDSMLGGSPVLHAYI